MLTLPRHMRVAMDTLSVRTSKLELKKQKRDGTLVWDEVGSGRVGHGEAGSPEDPCFLHRWV